MYHWLGPMLPYAVLFIAALAASLSVTPPVRWLARRAGVLDTPDGRRRLHQGPIPKLGGVAVFLSFYFGLWSVSTLWSSPAVEEALQLAVAMFVPSLIILLLGIADDRWSVSPWVKIAVQLASGLLIFYHLDVRIDFVANPFTGNSALGILSLPATLFWIVLVTNAFNIVDGMDGLAAGVALIALSCMFLVSLQMNNFPIALVVAALAGSVAGFLKYNFNPASIFLGDSGSLFLGFQLAVLSMIGSQKSSTAIAVAAPLFILALPLVETAASTARRFLTGRSIMQADSGHFHHQLIRLGFTPRRAAVLLYMGSAAFGLGSLFIIQSDAITIGLIAVMFMAVTWIAIQRLGYTEFAEINSALRRFVHQRRIIQNSILIRTLADKLRASESVTEAWALLKAAAGQLGFSYVELSVASAADGADSPQKNYAEHLTPHVALAASDTSFGVALVGAKGVLGEVVFSRHSTAPPLHSEVPLLIEAVAHELPPILEKHAFSEVASRPVLIVPGLSTSGLEPALPAAVRVQPSHGGDVTCPSCASADVHRSRSRSRIERLRKNFTVTRLHECAVCGWRGWVRGQPVPTSEQPWESICEAPDLQAIDVAFANAGDSSVKETSKLVRVTVRRTGEPRVARR